MRLPSACHAKSQLWNLELRGNFSTLTENP
jgi:hypothetical protein